METKVNTGKVHQLRMFEVIQVITPVGSGTEIDPSRLIAEYFTKKGRKLFIEDPFTGSRLDEDYQ